MKKSYGEWSKYNVDEELNKLKELEEREERDEGRKKASKLKSQLEKEVAATTQVSAEVLSAQAAVAALKAKKRQQQKDNNQATVAVSDLQSKAALLKLKSDTIKFILDSRATGQVHMKKEQYDAALTLYQEALKQLEKLSNVLPQLKQFDESPDQHTHCTSSHSHPVAEPPKADDHPPNEDAACCGHEHQHEKKPIDYAASLPDKKDIDGVLRMFRHDLCNGIGQAHLGKKTYALASEAFKTVLLDDPQNTIAWFGRGRAFSRMGVPLLAFLHFNQVLLYDPEHDEAKDEIDLAKAAIDAAYYTQESDLFNEQVRRLTQHDGKTTIQDTLISIRHMRAEADILMIEGLYKSALVKYKAILDALDDDQLLPAHIRTTKAIQYTKYGCHLNIAGCMIERQTTPAEAAHHCRMALEIQPESVVASFRKGQALQLCQDYAQALADFKLAKDRCRSDPARVLIIDRVIDKCTYDRSQCDLDYIIRSSEKV